MFSLLCRLDRVRARRYLRKHGFPCDTCDRLTLNRPAAPWPGAHVATSCTPCALAREARADRARPELIVAADRLLAALKSSRREAP